MIKEASSFLSKNVLNPLRRRIEFRTDQRSWNALVSEKKAEAKINELPSRFIWANRSGDQQHFTIVTKGSRTIVFYYLDLHTGVDIFMGGEPSQQAIVLEPNKNPRYAREVEGLKNLPKFWSVSSEGEDLDWIGNGFRYLKKAKLFDSRKRDLYWKAPVPDLDGLIKALDSPLE